VIQPGFAQGSELGLKLIELRLTIPSE